MHRTQPPSHEPQLAAMKHIRTPRGVTVSFDRYGTGPLLVLVHGGFSDHRTNWSFVKPLFERSFTVCAVARRGRGDTDATTGHSMDDEVDDVVAVVESLDAPVFLLGHSYGAHCVLGAALRTLDRVRKVVAYEPAWPWVLGPERLAPLDRLVDARDWNGFPFTFFRDVLLVPVADLETVRATPELWQPIVDDAEASVGDLRAISRYSFDPERFRGLTRPVMLQIGTESPRDLYVTDALAAVLPDVHIGELQGQAHEGMTTAPEQYAQAVARFLLD